MNAIGKGSGVVLGAALVFLSTPALPQDTPAGPKPRFHGFGLKLHAVKASRWTFNVPASPYFSAAGPAAGLGLNLSYAFIPTVAAYLAADDVIEDLDNLRGWATYEAGLQVRFPLHRFLMPYASAGLAHLSSSDFPRYNFAALGVGTEFFPLRRLAFHYGLQFCLPLEDARWGGSSVTLDKNYHRQFFGLSLYLGARR